MATGSATGSSGTATASSGAGGAPASPCDVCAAGQPAGNVASDQVTEASGLVASRVHADVYYLHNDSGDAARFFAMDGAGVDRGVYSLEGVTAVDWEDIAAGPCGADSCLYIGDIGDNPETRTSYVVHRVVEPATSLSSWAAMWPLQRWQTPRLEPIRA